MLYISGFKVTKSHNPQIVEEHGASFHPVTQLITFASVVGISKLSGVHEVLCSMLFYYEMVFVSMKRY